MRSFYLAIVIMSAVAPVMAMAQHAQHNPRFEIPADTVLTDERIPIALDGLAPKQLVTIRLSAENGGLFSHATFRSDEHGRLDLATSAPLSGEYKRAHPMGLFWTAGRDTGSARPTPIRQVNVRVPTQTWVMTAEVDGRVVATDTLWRRAVAPGVRIMPVRERDLVGHVYFPAGDGPHPALIVLPGSQGGIPQPAGPPGGLASRGYVVLALAYFAAEGLSPNLANIPLEYFATAIDWLKAQREVDSTRIGIFGGSRGGELALLLGATYPELRVVVANAPSHVVWSNMMGELADAPAWTLGGKPVPGMPHRFDPQAAARKARCASAANCPQLLTIHNFLARLDNKSDEARAIIPVERINGPVLMITGQSDSLWPSTMMAKRVEARLNQHNFKYAVEHWSYENAGHMIGRPYMPMMSVTQRVRHPISGRMTVAGGTPEGSALASEDAWAKTIAFLERHLRSRNR